MFRLPSDIGCPVVYSRPDERPTRFATTSALKWLYPGMHIKRWLLLLLFGIALMGLGIAYVLQRGVPRRRPSRARSTT